MVCLMLFARRLPTTIFSQLTVSEALKLLGQTFIVINTKFFPAVVRPANLSRISPEPSWSLEGTWATFATSNTRVFRLDWSTLALGTWGSSIQFCKSELLRIVTKWELLFTSKFTMVSFIPRSFFCSLANPLVVMDTGLINSPTDGVTCNFRHFSPTDGPPSPPSPADSSLKVNKWVQFKVSR